MPSESVDADTPTKRLELSVVVVTFNSSEVVLGCLASIGPRFDDAIEVVLVDNGSADDTVALVEGAFPAVRVVRSPTNGGFAAGVKAGVAIAGASRICLLNPDAVVDRVTLLELAGRLRDDESLGIVAPMVRTPGGRLRIVPAGWMPTVWRMFAHFSGLSRFGRLASPLEGHYLLPNQVAAERDVEWVTGACLLVSADVWRKVGGISQRWFMYAEDIELCFRVIRAGYRIRLYPDLSVTHLVGASAKGHAENVSSSWITNLREFYDTDISRSRVQRCAWRVVVTIGLSSRAAGFFLRSGGRNNRWRLEAKRFLVCAADVARKDRSSDR